MIKIIISRTKYPKYPVFILFLMESHMFYVNLWEIESRCVRWWTFSAEAGSDLAAAAVPRLGAAPLVASPPATVQASQTRHQGAALVMLGRQLGHCGHDGRSHTSSWHTPETQQRTIQNEHQRLERLCSLFLQRNLLWCNLRLNLQETPSFLQHFTLMDSHKPYLFVIFTVRPALVKLRCVIHRSFCCFLFVYSTLKEERTGQLIKKQEGWLQFNALKCWGFEFCTINSVKNNINKYMY